MINQLVVLNSPAANGADASVDNLGNLVITGADAIPASSIVDVVAIPAQAEQAKKQVLTFTSENSATYSFLINGYSKANGNAVQKLVQWQSSSANTTALTSAAITAIINAFSDFNVSAENTSAGVVTLTASTYASNPNCPFASQFTIAESDSKLTVTDPLTLTFTAAPTGGRTATGYAVVADGGTVTSIVITDCGSGYLAAPSVTFAGGGGSSAAATGIIFEGEVVATTISNAGSGYTSRIGVVPVGTVQSLQNIEYNYVANSLQSNTAPSYPQLSQLVSGATYNQFIISYNINKRSGNTTFTQTTTTGQIAVLVRTGQTNTAVYSDAGYGVFANLRKGWRSTYQAAVALNGSTAVTTTTYVVATGALTLSAAVSNGIKGNDLVLVGTTPAYGNTADTNAIGRILSLTSLSGLLVQIGGGNLVSAITGQTLATTFVIRNPLSR